MPQFQGAGLTLRTVTGAPRWAGELVVAVVVISTVAAGGMRSITFVQAFQFWLKITAILVPAVFLALSWHSHGSPSLTRDARAALRARTVVTGRRTADPGRPCGNAPGHRHRRRASATPVRAVRLGHGEHRVGAGTRLDFPPGARCRSATDLPSITDRVWSKPMSSGREHSLFATYSLIIATLLGTMGLPHILVRFYTNPDGRRRAGRRSPCSMLLGLFYLGPTLFGALGRIYTPGPAHDRRLDSVVLGAAARMVGGAGGHVLSALVTAGAFAAFLSTAGGLTCPPPRCRPGRVPPGRRAHLPAGRDPGDPRAVRPGARRRRHAGRQRRQPGLRRRRLDLLPACWSSASGGAGCRRSGRPPG